jgi:hypothetical protein
VSGRAVLPLMCLWLAAPPARAEDGFWGPRTTVSYDGGKAVVDGSALNVAAEHAFLPQLTAFVSLGGWRRNPYWLATVDVGCRYFSGGTGPRGFFFELVGTAKADYDTNGGWSSTDINGETTSGINTRLESQFGLGLALGYTWIPWRQLVISVGAGGVLAQISQRAVDGMGEYSGAYLLPLLRGAVGYAF